MAAAAAPAAAGAAVAGSNPKPNPSANGPGLRQPGKPVALADITNTGRPNPPKSINVGDVLKENAKLVHLLGEKTKIIEVSSAEMHKLRFALHATRQQNLILAQTNSQILAELNQGKDRLKALQHELACTTAVLKAKASELQRKNKAANQLEKLVTSQEEIKTVPSKIATVEAHQADNKAMSANVHHLVETQPAVPSNTVRQEAPPDKTNKRMSRRANKQKSESCEDTKDTNTVQPSYKPHLESIGSSHHVDLRNTLRRRSTRLNLGSCEMTEVSRETLHKDTAVSSSSCFSVPELHGPNSGKVTRKAIQDELLCNASVHKVKASELKKSKINKQPQKDVNIEEEINEACSRVAGVEGLEAHQIDDTNPNHFAETQSSLPCNIQHSEPPQERANKRCANKRKSKSYEGRKDSNMEEDISAKCQSTSSEPLHHEDMRKCLRRKSSRLNLGSFEVTKGTLEIAQEDTIAPLTPSSSNVLIEQSKKEQNDYRSSTEPSKEQVTGRSSVQVTGRRSSMRAAGKAVSYKEIPVNVKMRRP